MPKIIPYGDRILVKRQPVGEKVSDNSSIVLPDNVAEKDTDICEVMYVPDHSFADRALIINSPKIIDRLCIKAAEGDSGALKALLEFNVFLKIKSVKVGDKVFISKYSGTNWSDNAGNQDMTIIRGEDIIGTVVNG